MFDPTIFDNLKVVLEGCVYDLDMEGTLSIKNRIDRVELSTMSRYYAIQFSLPKTEATDESKLFSSYAEISLQANLQDLAAEILETEFDGAGSFMEITFFTQVQEPDRECGQINEQLSRIWQDRPALIQRLSYMYKQPSSGYENEIRLDFERKVDERQIEDFPEMLQFVVKSLMWLNESR